MTVFEFLLVILSIIIGLGMAELLAGVARVFRGELRWGGLHSVWVLTVFLLQVQQLWYRWSLRDRPEWYLLEFMLFLAAPILLYLAAATLFPTAGASDTLDDHLLARRRPIFLLITGVMATYSLEEWLVFGAAGITSQDLFRFVFIIGSLILVGSGSRRVHWVVGTWLFLQVLVFSLLFTPSVTSG